MSLAKKNLGNAGETIASEYLVSKGYQLLERNFRAKQYGEVDIICLHPHRKTIVFVEVKTRISDEFGRPEEAVTKGKLAELKKMVDYYYSIKAPTVFSPQIDTVAIQMTAEGDVTTLEHFENVTL